MKQYGLLIDLDRCIGCYGCQVACKSQNGVALGPSRTTLYTMGPTGAYPNLQLYFLPLMCQQCAEPECVKVCPTGACYKSGEDGVIYIDREVCIGCRTCEKSCPYGAIIYNKELKIVDKCDLCESRRAAGEQPACARNCAGAAIFCGDLNDPQSEISKRLAEAGDRVFSLEDGGSRPMGRFILKTADWQSALPDGAAHRTEANGRG